jgi:SAM-dependent methyltransferase
MNSSSPATVGVEKIQPPVSNCQSTSGWGAMAVVVGTGGAGMAQPASRVTRTARTNAVLACPPRMPNVYQFKDFEGSSHRILLDLIRRHAPQGKLLDLGAAGGELGAALHGQFQRTIGFEFDADRIGELHGRFDQAVIADLEQVPRLPQKVDAIVLADVLEHLRDPVRVLILCRDALSDHGHLFISVPNIANVTIRVGLLFGIFRYRERGILDATHLRFYTKHTIREEVEGAGFEVVSVHGSSIPVRLIAPMGTPELLIRAGERMLTGATRMWRAMFAYQILLVARKRP